MPRLSGVANFDPQQDRGVGHSGREHEPIRDAHRGDPDCSELDIPNAVVADLLLVRLVVGAVNLQDHPLIGEVEVRDPLPRASRERLLLDEPKAEAAEGLGYNALGLRGPPPHLCGEPMKDRQPANGDGPQEPGPGVFRVHQPRLPSLSTG